MKTSAVRKSYPTYGFRVGARNSVSSAAWEKPHRSGWTPILEGEFDLAYSPLMELTLEKGLVVLCSLDVEGRNEPVARMLTQRVVDYAAAAKPEPRRPVFYLGNPQGETLLQSLSAPFTKAAGAVPAGALLVVGPGATLADPLVRSVAAGGGRVFAFGQEQIPAGPAVEQKPFRCGDTTPCLERTARPHRERSPLAHRKNAAAARG
jgi:beta-galactosidase